MRWFMYLGVVFFFFITWACVSEGLKALTIIREGNIINAEFVKKPPRYIPSHGVWSGAATFRYNGVEFRKNMLKHDAEAYTIGQTRRFYYSDKYPDYYLNSWETEGRQWGDIGAGVFFFLFGGFWLFAELVWRPRRENQEAYKYPNELLLPNGKRRGKAKYSHLVLRKKKKEGK